MHSLDKAYLSCMAAQFDLRNVHDLTEQLDAVGYPVVDVSTLPSDHEVQPMESSGSSLAKTFGKLSATLAEGESYFSSLSISEMCQIVVGDSESIYDPCCGIGNLCAGLITAATERLVLGDVDRKYRAMASYLCTQRGIFDVTEYGGIDENDDDDYRDEAEAHTVVVNPPFSLIDRFVMHGLRYYQKWLVLVAPTSYDNPFVNRKADVIIHVGQVFWGTSVTAKVYILDKDIRKDKKVLLVDMRQYCDKKEKVITAEGLEKFRGLIESDHSDDIPHLWVSRDGIVDGWQDSVFQSEPEQEMESLEDIWLRLEELERESSESLRGLRRVMVDCLGDKADDVWGHV